MLEKNDSPGTAASGGGSLTPPIVMTPPPSENESLDLNNVEVIDDLNINRWLMRIMRLGASYVSTGSNGYRTASVSSSSSGSRSRRLSIADTSASNLLRPPNTSRGRRFSDSMNFDVDSPWTKFHLQRSAAASRKGLKNLNLEKGTFLDDFLKLHDYFRPLQLLIFLTRFFQDPLNRVI